MDNSRKQITFDLDTKALEKYYPTKSWNNAYEVIKRHMDSNGFEWLQGSVYVSRSPMEPATVTLTLTLLVKQNPWLNLCMCDCRETNIGKEHSKNHIFDKEAEVPARNLVDFPIANSYAVLIQNEAINPYKLRFIASFSLYQN